MPLLFVIVAGSVVIYLNPFSSVFKRRKSGNSPEKVPGTYDYQRTSEPIAVKIFFDHIFLSNESKMAGV
jgi:hypothetical protein